MAAEQAQTARERDEKAAALVASQQRLAQVERGVEVLASVFDDLGPRAEQKGGKRLGVILGERVERAAEQLEGRAFSDPLTVAWTREHHLPAEQWSVPPALGAALKAADDD